MKQLLDLNNINFRTLGFNSGVLKEALGTNNYLEILKKALKLVNVPYTHGTDVNPGGLALADSRLVDFSATGGSGSPVAATLTPAARELNRFSYTKLFEAPKGFLAASIGSFSKTGAMSTATITSVGQYDKVSVTGGDATSRIRFDNHTSINEVIFKLKIKVTALGTTPLVGLVLSDVPSGTYSNFTSPDLVEYVNLLTGVITGTGEDASPTITTDNQFGTAVVGDIVEVIFRYDFNNVLEFSVSRGIDNYTTWRKLVYAGRANEANAPNIHGTPQIILADGDYLILDFHVATPVTERPKIMIVGDSFGAGSGVDKPRSVRGHLEKKIPYGVACNAGPSAMLAGVQATVHEVLALRPEYAIFIAILDGMFYDYSNPSNPNYTSYKARLRRYINQLKMAGIKPIFFKITSNPILPAIQCTRYSTLVDTEFPGELVLDMRGYAWTYDVSGFHPSGVANEAIADALIQLLKTDGGL